MLFFTDKGKGISAQNVRTSGGYRATKGKSIMNYLSIASDEKVTSVLPMPKSAKEVAGTFAHDGHQLGTAKKVKAKVSTTFVAPVLIAITLEAGDELISVSFVSKGDSVSIVTTEGQSIRFDQDDIREMGRGAMGVRGIRLAKGDKVINADVIKSGAEKSATDGHFQKWLRQDDQNG